MPRVAIIGTAGRKGPPLTAQLYERMHTEVERVITEVWGLKWDEVDLVSGGAAWSGAFTAWSYSKCCFAYHSVIDC
jgi:hypothetical protein